jgi:hypothetical protein
MARKNKVRVVIPTNPEEIIRLGLKIMAKHEQDGDSSPLRVLELVDPKRVLTFAEGENIKGKEHRQKSEHCLQNRDNSVGHRLPLLIGTVRHFVTSARDVLLGRHKGEERALADWGFEVHFGSHQGPDKPDEPEEEKGGK